MNSWKKVRLGDICTVVSGTTPKSNVPEFWNGDLNWVTPAELNDETKVIYITQRKITPAAVRASSLKPFPAGTVLLSSRAPIGKIAIAGTEMYCNQGFKNLICSERIHNGFLYRYLKGKTEYLNSLGRGATFKEISKTIVEDIQIPLPPINEQRRIASVLDKISHLIAQRKQQIEQLDLIIKSRFIEMFEGRIKKKWENKRLDEIATTRLGKMLDAKKQTGICSYPYLANFNVRWFGFDLERLKEMDFNEDDRIEFSLMNGDLLICEGGEVGRTAIWRGERANCFFQKALHRVRCNPEMCVPEYIAWVMYFKAQNGQFNEVATTATIAHLPSVKLKVIKFSLPPLELQNAFADFVQQVDKSKFEVQQGLKKLELQYNALMQEYFG